MLAEAFILQFGMIISAAAVFAIIARSLKIPSIIGYIIAGLILGPITGLVAVDHSIEVIAEVGIILLLFLVGLELSLDKVKDIGRVAVVTAAIQMTLTVITVFGLSYGLGFSVLESLILGIALMFSSTVVVIKLLEHSKKLDSLFGRISVGVLLVEDLVVIIALTVLAAFARGGGEIELGGLLGQLGLAFLGMLVLLGTAALASAYLLPRPFAWIARSREGLLVWSLSLCFIFVLMAEGMHLSIEIGAFLAGLCLAQMPHHHQIQKQVHPLTNLFIAVFFVSLGLQMQLGAALNYSLATFLFIALIMIGRPLVLYALISHQGHSPRTAFLSAITLSQTSEFSFIFMALAVGTGLIGVDFMSIVALIGLVTMSLSSFLYLRREALFHFWIVRGWLKDDEAFSKKGALTLSDHIIVVGMNEMGRAIAKCLSDAGEKVLAMDTDLAKLNGLPCKTLIGSANDQAALQDAGFLKAKLIVSALRIEEANQILTYRARQAKIPISVHAFEREVVEQLEELGADHLLKPKIVAAELQMERLREKGLIPS
jgi:Kef-type K+ transport system membrane component KefB